MKSFWKKVGKFFVKLLEMIGETHPEYGLYVPSPEEEKDQH
jgi:hypothetical protein